MQEDDIDSVNERRPLLLMFVRVVRCLLTFAIV